MATFKRQKKLIAEPNSKKALDSQTDNSTEVDIVTELSEQQPKTAKPTVLKHQFDDSGMQYEGKQLPVRALLASVLLIVLAGGVLLVTLTPQGKTLLESITNPTISTGDNVVPDNTDASLDSENAAQLPPVRDFSESSESEIRSQLTEDATLVEEQLDPTDLFGTPDWELELGL